jgi:hypothetical protein
MNVTTQESEEKRKQLLAKELAIKRNLSLVWRQIISSIEEKKMSFLVKALRDGAELFVDATEFCSQLDW